MVLAPLDQRVYEKAQVEIGYCKLFPHILEDFVTRKDMAQIIRSDNLPTSTNVIVPINGLAGTIPVTGTANGPAQGTVQPVYNGSIPSPASVAMKVEKEAIKNAGGTATSAALGSA